MVLSKTVDRTTCKDDNSKGRKKIPEGRQMDGFSAPSSRLGG
jgi:hypothetical protein